jgi:hypothetical protein
LRGARAIQPKCQNGDFAQDCRTCVYIFSTSHKFEQTAARCFARQRSNESQISGKRSQQCNLQLLHAKTQFLNMCVHACGGFEQHRQKERLETARKSVTVHLRPENPKRKREWNQRNNQSNNNSHSTDENMDAPLQTSSCECCLCMSVNIPCVAWFVRQWSSGLCVCIWMCHDVDKQVQHGTTCENSANLTNTKHIVGVINQFVVSSLGAGLHTKGFCAVCPSGCPCQFAVGSLSVRCRFACRFVVGSLVGRGVVALVYTFSVLRCVWQPKSINNSAIFRNELARNLSKPFFKPTLAGCGRTLFEGCRFVVGSLSVRCRFVVGSVRVQFFDLTVVDHWHAGRGNQAEGT